MMTTIGFIDKRIVSFSDLVLNIKNINNQNNFK